VVILRIRNELTIQKLVIESIEERTHRDKEEFAEIVGHPTQWSPVAASLRNPVDVQAELV
jgi:hypothetical protein